MNQYECCEEPEVVARPAFGPDVAKCMACGHLHLTKKPPAQPLPEVEPVVIQFYNPDDGVQPLGDVMAYIWPPPPVDESGLSPHITEQQADELDWTDPKVRTEFGLTRPYEEDEALPIHQPQTFYLLPGEKDAFKKALEVPVGLKLSTPKEPVYARVMNLTDVPVVAEVCMDCWRSGWTITTEEDVKRTRRIFEDRAEALKAANTEDQLKIDEWKSAAPFNLEKLDPDG